MSGKSISKNILAVLLGISVSLILLEGLLRVFQPIEYRVKGNKIKLLRDKKYQFINDKTDKLDKIIYSTRNHMGFRGEAAPKNFADYLTIIAVGGSTTECVLIADGKTWCDILADKLKEKFKPLWLNNAGLDGTSTYGNIILLEDYLIKIRPKMILFLLGANDIGEGDHGIADEKYLKKPRSGLLAPIWERLINNSEFLGYAVNFYRYSRAQELGLVHRIWNFAELPLVNMPAEQVQRLLQTHKENFLKPYAQRLTRLIDLCRDNFIEPVFITQSTVFGEVIDPVTGKNLGRASTYGMNGKTLGEVLELYNDVLRNTARQQQVFVIDLAREMPKNTAYYYDTYHFSNAGCQKVAEIIDQRLEPVLAEKYPQFSASKP